eukprot:174129-Prymnesium_polylepis.1
MLIAIFTSLATAVDDLLDGGPPDSDGPVSSSSLITRWGSAFATTFYAFEGVGLVLPIENQLMRRPTPGASAAAAEGLPAGCFEALDYSHILCGTMAIVATFFGLVGAFCAAAFPPITTASVTAFLASRGAYYEFVNVLVASA